MSYILDALRRADAERGRGAVPGLHTQATLGAGALADTAQPAAARPWLMAVGGVAVAAVAAGATWWTLQPRAPAAGGRVAMAPAAVAPPASATRVPPAPGPAVPTAPGPLPVPTGAGAPPPSPPARTPAAARPEARDTDQRKANQSRGATPSTAPVGERERPAAPRVDVAALGRVQPAETARPRPLATSAPARPAPGSQPAPEVGVAPPASPIYAQADLPEALRTQLPTLKVTGATHSSNPVYRMAIVNGQVLHEGDQAAPGLLLERIEPGRTVWSFKGYRYAVAAQ